MKYIDFYLLHGVTDLTVADYETSGCIPYFQEQKRAGRIKYLGFSFHGTPECLEMLLEKHPWDFVQIQLNFYDWYHRTAKRQYEILCQRDIPIMVMEPIHGGMLANLPESCQKLLPEETSPADLALRFVMELPGAAVILSGMSNLQQVQELSLIHISMQQIEINIFHLQTGKLFCILCFIVGICLYIKFVRYVETLPRILRKLSLIHIFRRT